MSEGVRWATRCNQCGTSFRVHEDQLAASEGYVRCGRCDAVFNARSTLFDLDSPGSSRPMELQAETAPRSESWAAAPADPPNPAPAGGAVEAHEPDGAMAREPDAAGHADMAAEVGDGAGANGVRDEPAPMPADTADATAFAEASEPVWTPEPTAPGPVATEPHWVDEAPASAADARAEPGWSAEPAATLAPDARTARMRTLLGEPGAPDSAPAALAALAPPAQWSSLERRSAPAAPRSRGQRVLGALACVVLALGLPAQWVWVERDALRARSPALAQWLRTQVPSLPESGWRHLEGLSVVSSSLQATPQGGAYQLDLVLHNQAAHPLAAPWLDLSLSDAAGKLLLRRAVDPQLLGAGATLAAGEQRRLRAVFRVEGGAVSGYEIGLFHP